MEQSNAQLKLAYVIKNIEALCELCDTNIYMIEKIVFGIETGKDFENEWLRAYFYFSDDKKPAFDILLERQAGEDSIPFYKEVLWHFINIHK